MSSPPAPEVSYLARDFAALRQRLLDRLALTLPGWVNRQVPDVTMTLVELLAFVGDRLSYHQDAVATEAYIGTARRRVSVRRHARLVDETLHEGCSARAVVLIEQLDPQEPVGELTVVTAFDGAPAGPSVLLRPPEHGGEVFTSLAASVPPTFQPLWLVADLAPGATAARVSGPGAYDLRAGSLLAFVSGAERLHPVRLLAVEQLPGGDRRLTWHWEDRLPFRAEPKLTQLDAAVLCVEHGRPIRELLESNRRLRRGPVTFSDQPLPHQSLQRLLRPDPLRATPLIRLHEEESGQEWHWRPDLIASRSDDAHFTLDIDDDGVARVRFGDGSCGRLDPGVSFVVDYRVGNGQRGNVGAGALIHAVGGHVAVAQPFSARGGVEPEAIDSLRARLALGGTRTARAVVARDYAAVAERHPRVHRAAAQIDWSGSGELVRVAIDPKSDYELPADLKRELEQLLAEVRRIGHDVSVEAARLVPIRVWLDVTVRREHSRSGVGAAIRGKLRELLHPDRLSFGQPIYQSHLLRAVRQLGGVESISSIDVTRLTDGIGLDDDGVLRMAPLEIARFQDDELRPWLGDLDLSLRGGR